MFGTENGKLYIVPCGPVRLGNESSALQRLVKQDKLAKENLPPSPATVFAALRMLSSVSEDQERARRSVLSLLSISSEISLECRADLSFKSFLSNGAWLSFGTVAEGL